MLRLFREERNKVMNQNKNIKRFLKCFLAGMAIVTLICFTHASVTVSQWPYNNNWSSGSPFMSPFYSSFMSPFFNFNPVFNYSYNNLLFPYNNLNPIGPYSLPESWPGNLGRYGSTITSYNPSVPFVSPWTFDPGFFPPGWGPYGPGALGIYGGPGSAGPYPGPIGGSIILPPQPRSYCDPESAPARFSGKWQSQQLTDESGDLRQGTLKIDKISNQQIVIMTDSSLPLVEGSISQFKYTRTQGKAPISFKSLFY